MNQIARCDWLPERAIWNYLARSGKIAREPTVPREENFPKREAGGSLALIQASLCFAQQKQWRLYQNKLASSLTAIQRPGHWADYCKMV